MRAGIVVNVTRADRQGLRRSCWIAARRRNTRGAPTSSSPRPTAAARPTLCADRQRLKRGVFRSVIDLQVAINRFVAETNVDPKPFVWTADPKRVLAAVKRGKQTLESVH